MRIAIVGGGPAGAMAAFHLARRGAAVTLFDHSHPREKPCGGGLTGRALSLLSGVLDLDALDAIVITSALVEPPGAQTLHGAACVPLAPAGVSSESALVVCSRSVLDSALVDAAQRAGAAIVREKIVRLARRGAAFDVVSHRGTHTADFVIGADGANSLVRKTFARPFTRAEISVAAGYFVHGIESSAIVVQTMKSHPGYLWSFPRRDHLAVGVCAPATDRTSSATLLQGTLRWIESHGYRGAICPSPYAWPIPSDVRERTHESSVAGEGWMLVGDAAGLVDPLTREGIYYAFLSGTWAADALTGSRPSARYQQQLDEHIYPELRRAARLTGLFFSEPFSLLLVDALKERESIRRVFADLVSGTQPYRGLRRRLLRTGEWRLAGRALRLVVQ